MTSCERLLATVLLLAPVCSCGPKQEQPPVAGQPPVASTTPAVPATEASAVATAPPTATSAPAPPPAAVVATTTTTTPTTTTATTTTTAPLPPTTVAPKTRSEAPPRPKGKIMLPAKLGVVTFDHEKHARRGDGSCAACHHPSRSEKRKAWEQQACRDCHTTPAAAPMRTSLQAAFHDPRAATGTCIGCHKEQKAGTAPVKCLDCHKKGA